MLLPRCLLLLCALAGVLAVPARLRKHLDVGLQIVGGNTVDIEDFPYQISMEKYGEHDCGGSILNNQWILTAAHCLHLTTDVSIIGVRYGTSKREQGGTLLEAKFIGVHDKYDHDTHQYDVALIQVAKDIVYSSVAKPVTMTDIGSKLDPMDVLTVSGWGILNSYDWDGPVHLYAVQVPYVPRATCRISYEFRNKKIDDSMICAGLSGKDACQGDSGGPLVNDLGVQVGVVSWGIGCGNPGFAGVYADLANAENRRWIKDTAGIE